MLTITRCSMKKNILFLCTGNSCRSQMAEGWTRHLLGDLFEPFSAGTEVHGVNPNAVQVMAEAGVDITGHRSKVVDELVNVPFDYIVTVCDRAREACPLFPGAGKKIHRNFDDPAAYQNRNGGEENEEEVLVQFRRIRDEIREFVQRFPDSMDR